MKIKAWFLSCLEKQYFNELILVFMMLIFFTGFGLGLVVNDGRLRQQAIEKGFAKMHGKVFRWVEEPPYVPNAYISFGSQSNPVPIPPAPPIPKTRKKYDDKNISY